MKRRVPLAIATVASALLMAAPSSGAAVREPSDKAKLAALTKELTKLDKELGGELEELKDLRHAADKALQRKEDLKGELAKSQTVVARLSSAKYMNQGLDPTLAVLQTEADPGAMLKAVGLVDYLTSNESNRVGQIQYVIDLQSKANKDAKQKIKKLQVTLNEMKSRKAEIEKLIRKYKPESPGIGMNGMTPRMHTLFRAVESEWGPFPMIGCLRVGDPQDHGTGRACDFMESTAGRFPTADRVTHGNKLLAWLIANHSKYGVKYVIWRQRYYDMRNGGAGRPMSDRGSVTQNHYDHVHVSVF